MKYHIRSDYTHRANEEYFDDTKLKDEWQKEVYEYAKSIVIKNNYSSIIDFGCGSGFKLIDNFNEFNTIGIDVPQTVEFLRATYPDKQWSTTCDIHNNVDVFIASDVIEHMLDPNILIEYIKSCNPKEIVFSTPEKTLVTLHYPDLVQEIMSGPPINSSHVREWTYEEFQNYISEHFDIVTHIITNESQATQMIHCRMKK